MKDILSSTSRAALRLLALILTLGCWCQQIAAQDKAVTDYLGLSRELLNKYYEMQKVLGKEEADWKLGKDILSSRIELMEAQLKELQEKTKEENSNITQNDTEREKLDAHNQELIKTESLQLDAVEKLEARVRKLEPQFPEVLRTKLGAQLAKLPDPKLKRDEVKLRTGERFLNVLAIMNEVNKFNGEITVVNERRKTKAGREVEVRTIYFGLGIAYYAGSGETADVAGLLVPGPKGWESIEKPEISQQVNDVIAMNKSEMVAGFVPLPVKIK